MSSLSVKLLSHVIGVQINRLKESIRYLLFFIYFRISTKFMTLTGNLTIDWCSWRSSCKSRSARIQFRSLFTAYNNLPVLHYKWCIGPHVALWVSSSKRFWLFHDGFGCLRWRITVFVSSPWTEWDGHSSAYFIDNYNWTQFDLMFSWVEVQEQSFGHLHQNFHFDSSGNLVLAGNLFNYYWDLISIVFNLIYDASSVLLIF